MTGWVCQWKPFWIPVEDSFKKVYLEEWVFISDAPSEAKPQEKACFWERIEAPLPPLWPRRKCDFIHPQQLIPFPERLELPFSSDATLSGYEDLVPSGSDHFTMWSKMNPYEILAEHVVDIHKVVADSRDAFERNRSYSSQSYGVNKYFSSQSLVQKRLSIYKWNLGPDVERKTHLRNKLRGNGTGLPCKKHLNFVDHDILQERFHVTH